MRGSGAAGLPVARLAAHNPVHQLPPIFSIVTRLAKRFQIPVVRVPFERWPGLHGDTRQKRTAAGQALMNAAMLPWARRDYRSAAQAGVRTPHFIRRAPTGVLSAPALAAMGRGIPPRRARI